MIQSISKITTYFKNVWIKKFLYKLRHRTFKKIGIDIISYPIKTVTVTNPYNSASLEKEVPIQVHMFWAYGNLTRLERLAAASFVANGFDLKIWTYGSITNLPKGISQFDAREVIPESRIFKYKNGSYSGFSNLFRYKILSLKGGLWADTDIICLASSYDIKKMSQDGFLVTQHTDFWNESINSNLIYHPNPKGGDLIDLAFAISERYQIENLNWGDCGPNLLTALVTLYPKLAPKIMSSEFANPIPSYKCPDILLKSKKISKNTWFLHCYNEVWRRKGIEKDNPYPPQSILGKLFAQYEDKI
jgi:hypothetical protein